MDAKNLYRQNIVECIKYEEVSNKLDILLSEKHQCLNNINIKTSLTPWEWVKFCLWGAVGYVVGGFVISLVFWMLLMILHIPETFQKFIILPIFVLQLYCGYKFASFVTVTSLGSHFSSLSKNGFAYLFGFIAGSSISCLFNKDMNILKFFKDNIKLKEEAEKRIRIIDDEIAECQNEVSDQYSHMMDLYNKGYFIIEKDYWKCGNELNEYYLNNNATTPDVGQMLVDKRRTAEKWS